MLESSATPPSMTDTEAVGRCSRSGSSRSVARTQKVWVRAPLSAPTRPASHDSSRSMTAWSSAVLRPVAMSARASASVRSDMSPAYAAWAWLAMLVISPCAASWPYSSPISP